jgi:hypothetical protein
MSGVEHKFIDLGVAGIITAVFLSVSIGLIMTTNTTTWTPISVSMWDLIPVFIVIAAVLGFIELFRAGNKRR